MPRWKMLFRVMARGLWVRPGKLLLSVAALTVGATLASAFLSLYFDLPSKMSSEFRTLGPNLIVAPRGDAQTFSDDVATRVSTESPSTAMLPWLYAVGKVDTRDVILAGTDLDGLSRMHPGWKMHPGWRSLPAMAAATATATALEGIVAGEKAAEQFGWSVGAPVRVSYAGQAITLPLLAIVSTGGSEDSQLLMPLATLQTLTGQSDQLSMIQLAAAGAASDVESVWHRTAASVADLPTIEVRALRPVVESEARVVMKVRAMMLGLAGIVMALVILSVLTSVSGRILDRQKDIGVMKALGGSDAGIARFFLAETAAQAVFAGALGFAAGFALAQLAAERVFHSAIALRWDVALAVMSITLGAALVATLLPARWIRRMDAAVILRGE
jgi:putative ABC transport system permease protein